MKVKIKYLIIFLIVISTQNIYAIRKVKVSFKNRDITLAGTLYIPKGDGLFPAVIFVHGSGPETRNNSSYSAKWLASLGYVVLIYDKRGTGESDGDKKTISRFSFDNLANDVVSGVNFLSKREKVDKKKIGIHAASQGGWVAALATSKTNLISFMIVKAASVTTVEEDRIFERSSRLREEGFLEKEILEVKEMQLVEAKTVARDKQPDSFTRLFEENKNKAWFKRVYTYTNPFDPELVYYRKWYTTIANFNPISYLEQIKIPIFWIFGDSNLDKLGPIEQSISNLERLKQEGKPYTIVQYKGEGHNIKEKKYEHRLYQWLCKINDYHTYKFKRH